MHAEAFLYVADSLGLDSRATGLRRRSTCQQVWGRARAHVPGHCASRRRVSTTQREFPFPENEALCIHMIKALRVAARHSRARALLQPRVIYDILIFMIYFIFRVFGLGSWSCGFDRPTPHSPHVNEDQ